MPKKKNPETPEQQSRRFKRDAAELINAGSLDPEAGAAGLDKIMAQQRRARPAEK